MSPQIWHWGRWVHSDLRGHRGAELPHFHQGNSDFLWRHHPTKGSSTRSSSLSASVKFINKIQYVHSLEELEQLIPMEHVQIPDCVLQ